LKKALLILFVLLIALSMAAFTFAQEELASSTEIITEETTADDLGVLPGNPFYFLKEWGRGIQRLFISDPIKQVEFELKITTEKGEELRKVSELNRQEAIEKAIKNYEEAMVRLQKHFEELKGLSENPNVNELLQKIAERTEEHEQLFQHLTEKLETLKGQLQPLQENWGGIIAPLFQNARDIEPLRNRVTEMLREGNPGYGVMSEIIERVGQEIQAQPTEESATTSSEAVSSELQTVGTTEEYWTEERMAEAKPYPMPTVDVNKWDSIMLEVRKAFKIGQTKYAIQPEICADVYIPVCGADGKSYSNECYATRAGVNVAHEGECRK